jgi:5'-AMP-activated protein kinase catalytic alpha subunit
MVIGNSYEGQKGDIWSLGIIFYGMVCGNLPFEENTTQELYKKVIEGLYFIPSDISLEATEVIKKMLVNDPAKRLTIPKLRKLKFFTDLRTVEPKLIGIIVGFHPMPIDN